VLVVQVLEMVFKVLHLFLVLSAQRVVVLDAETVALAVLVVLVVVLQTGALAVRLHLVKVILVVLAHQPALPLPQQVVVAAAPAQ
jgi:hypothetical protein